MQVIDCIPKCFGLQFWQWTCQYLIKSFNMGVGNENGSLTVVLYVFVKGKVKEIKFA